MLSRVLALGRRRVVRLGAGVAVTGAALAWVATRVDASTVWETIQQARLGWWAVAVALVPVQTMLAAERWCWASRALDRPIPRRQAWREFALSTAVNQLFPGGIAGDGIRAWRQRQQQQGLAGAARAVLADRWWGQTVLATVVVLGTLGWPASVERPPGLVPGVLVAAIGVVGVWLVPRRVPALGALSADLRRSARVAPLPLAALGFLLLAAILGGLAASGLAVGVAPGAWLWTAAPLTLLAASVPVSMGGWGLREGSLVAVVPLFGPSPDRALATALLFGLAFLVGALPGLLFWRAPAAEPTA